MTCEMTGACPDPGPTEDQVTAWSEHNAHIDGLVGDDQEPCTHEIGSVENDMGESISVGVDCGAIGLYVGGWLSADGITLNAAQRDEFMRLWCEAERTAEGAPLQPREPRRGGYTEGEIAALIAPVFGVPAGGLAYIVLIQTPDGRCDGKSNLTTPAQVRAWLTEAASMLPGEPSGAEHQAEANDGN